MKRHVAIAMLVLSTSAFAHADDRRGYTGIARDTDAALSTAAVPQGKTRKQVRRELAEAYRDGLLPTNNHDYPPSPATIARNKELNQRFGPGWGVDSPW